VLRTIGLPTSDPNASVQIRMLNQPESPEDFAATREFVVPSRNQYLIPAIQAGTYKFEIRAPGAATWISAPTVIKDSPKTISATLSKGRKVRVRLEMPKGAMAGIESMRLCDSSGHQAVISALEEERKEAIFDSLAPGAYTLSIPPSSEWKAEMLGTTASNEILLKPRNDPEWKGVTRKFQVTEKSPDTIDLGTIRVEALPKQSR